MVYSQITKVQGVDVFLEATFGAQIPKQIGSLTLKHVASRGTALTGTPADKQILDVGWVCARYLFAQPVPEAEIDAQVVALLQTLGKSFRWSSLMKLYEMDGKAAFSG